MTRGNNKGEEMTKLNIPSCFLKLLCKMLTQVGAWNKQAKQMTLDTHSAFITAGEACICKSRTCSNKLGKRPAANLVSPPLTLRIFPGIVHVEQGIPKQMYWKVITGEVFQPYELKQPQCTKDHLKGHFTSRWHFFWVATVIQSGILGTFGSSALCLHSSGSKHIYPPQQHLFSFLHSWRQRTGCSTLIITLVYKSLITKLKNTNGGTIQRQQPCSFPRSHKHCFKMCPFLQACYSLK